MHDHCKWLFNTINKKKNMKKSTKINKQNYVADNSPLVEKMRGRDKETEKLLTIKNKRWER